MQKQIKDLLESKPFLPFTVVMSSGIKHEVRHPENSFVSKHFLVIVDADDEDLLHNLYLLHVSALDVRTPSRAGEASLEK